MPYGGYREPVRRWTPWLSIVALAVPVLVLGVSWYLKNLLVHGNPVYPIGIGPFEGLAAGSYGAPPEPDALRGLAPIAQVAVSWAHDWQLDRYLYSQRPGGFGHAWLALAALAVVGLFLLVRRRPWPALLLVIAPVFLALAVLTSPWYARYTLFVPAVALPLAALTLDRLTPVMRTAAGIVLVGLAAISVVMVSAFPNVPLPIAPAGPERAAAYWGAVFDESDPLRAALAAPPSCRDALPELPPGARVAVAKSIFTPHAVVGSDLHATLVEPPPQRGGSRIPGGSAAGPRRRLARHPTCVAAGPHRVAGCRRSHPARRLLRRRPAVAAAAGSPRLSRPLGGQDGLGASQVSGTGPITPATTWSSPYTPQNTRAGCSSGSKASCSISLAVT